MTALAATLTTTFTAILILGFADKTVADGDISKRSLCDLALSLDAEVAEVTGYPHTAVCPDIRFGPLGGAAAQRSQAGAYYPETGAIELAEHLDLATAEARGFLLHGLVHAAQYRAGRQHNAACPAALEAEAYALQADYLFREGATKEAAMSRLLSGLLGACEAQY